MIWNIVDNRTRKYRWKTINAIVEAVEHDNSCKDADQAPDQDSATYVLYDALEAVSVSDAVAWAMGQRGPVTLFLYDEGGGFSDEEHFTEMGARFAEDGQRDPAEDRGDGGGKG
ncbi:hypothetical protein [Sphingomonas sp.]|jgi:hypothetical protein|uniref:hypothetical protein n=1 Tax=Sphingomonas sp. TaxID=28214 RepID=UPI002E124D7E|nr:hypothetical protein [Sphingomonas sp.]